jgi:hypothetical protein
MPATGSEVAPGPRATWRTVAVPAEHGGWGLTAEPALLGLLVAASWAGVVIAVMAVLAFVVRTPVKIVLVDRWRHRRYARTQLAARIAAVELVVLAALAAVVVRLSGWEWLIPVAIAAPLVGIELWFDMRSRSRRLVPELCGGVGIAAVVASVALAGSSSARLALALWLVLAARSLGSIPFVRVQIARLHHGTGSTVSSDRAQVTAAVVAAIAITVDPALAAGAVAVGALLVAQEIWMRRPPVPAEVLGLRQLLFGLGVVLVAAAGVLV